MERDQKQTRNGIGSLKNSLQTLLFCIVLWALKKLTILAFVLLRKTVTGCRVKDWEFYVVTGLNGRSVYRVGVEDINVRAEDDEIEVGVDLWDDLLKFRFDSDKI